MIQNMNIGQTVFKSIGGVILELLRLLEIPLIIAGITIGIIIGLFIAFKMYYRLFKKLKPTGTEHYKVKRENIFKVLWCGIKQAAYDHQTRNIEHIPENYTGLICIEGMPGKGKSTTAVWDAQLKQEEYPKMKLYSNMEITFQDGEINKWRDVMSYNNDEYGQVFILDELATLLNSRNFASFPPEALDLITQSRKIRTRILYTTQEFKMTDINIRRLTRQVWKPITLMQTICIILKFRPKVNSEGEVEKMKLIGIDYYRQTPEIRNSFDTRKQIAVLKRDGFAERSEQIRPETNIKKKEKEMKINIKQK